MFILHPSSSFPFNISLQTFQRTPVIFQKALKIFTKKTEELEEELNIATNLKIEESSAFLTDGVSLFLSSFDYLLLNRNVIFNALIEDIIQDIHKQFLKKVNESSIPDLVFLFEKIKKSKQINTLLTNTEMGNIIDMELPSNEFTLLQYNAIQQYMMDFIKDYLKEFIKTKTPKYEILYNPRVKKNFEEKFQLQCSLHIKESIKLRLRLETEIALDNLPIINWPLPLYQIEPFFSLGNESKRLKDQYNKKNNVVKGIKTYNPTTMLEKASVIKTILTSIHTQLKENTNLVKTKIITKQGNADRAIKITEEELISTNIAKGVAIMLSFTNELIKKLEILLQKSNDEGQSLEKNFPLFKATVEEALPLAKQQNSSLI